MLQLKNFFMDAGRNLNEHRVQYFTQQIPKHGKYLLFSDFFLIFFLSHLGVMRTSKLWVLWSYAASYVVSSWPDFSQHHREPGHFSKTKHTKFVKPVFSCFIPSELHLNFLTAHSRKVTAPHPPSCCQSCWHLSCAQIIFSSSTPGMLSTCTDKKWEACPIPQSLLLETTKKYLSWRRNKCTKEKVLTLLSMPS